MIKKKSKHDLIAESSPYSALLEKAQEHFNKSEHAKAEQLANEILSLADGNGNGDDTLTPGDKALALCILGSCCVTTARYDESLRHFNAACAIAEAASEKGLQARALNGIASVHFQRGDFASSLLICEQALANADPAHNTKEAVRTLNSMGSVYNALGDYTRALDSHTRSLVLAETLDDRWTEATILTNIGHAHSNLGDYPRALDDYGRALILYEESGDTPSSAKTLDGMGGVYATLSDYPRALDCLMRALAIAEKSGDKELRAQTLGNIGNVHLILQDYPRTMDYLARALELDEEIGSKAGIAIVLGNMGTATMNHGDYILALEYLTKALDLSLEIGARRPAGYWMESIAHTQHMLGNLDAAYHGFLDVLHHRYNVLESKEGIANTLINLSEVLIDWKRPEEALDRLQEALIVADELGVKEQTSHAHSEMSRAYAMMGNMAQAYEHLTKYHAIEKEIFTEESKKRVDIFNMRVAISEIEHGVEVQKLRIEHMEHDLANSAIHLAAQTDLLDHFRLDLSQIFREIEEPIAAMKRIKEKLKALPCQQIDWPKFEGQFNEVHPEFKTKLAQKYPELTQMEQRIAAMVRMDLKSSDIARLFCITERAVEFHRLNLRKKLGLKAGEMLPKFLSAL